MKLFCCLNCIDVVKLIRDVRSCRCGKSSGLLSEDKQSVQVNGPLKVIGFNDKTFFDAINNQPVEGKGKEFVAYVLPIVNKSVTMIGPTTATTTAPIKDPSVKERNVYLNPVGSIGIEIEDDNDK